MAAKLRKPCEHDRYDRHHLSEGLKVGDLTHCPGGEFLPEDALVIEKVEGEWPKLAKTIIHEWFKSTQLDPSEHPANALLHALADQVGEPG